MGIGADLKAYVGQVLGSQWQRRQGRTVPAPEDIELANVGVELDAVCLYADLADSTEMVTKCEDWLAAEIYKCFLHCAVKVILAEGGTITSFDGDRVMGIFVGDYKNSSAARAALKINWVTKNVVETEVKARYAAKLPSAFAMAHTCGIDASKVLAARTGVRGSNDLVWVGRAANYAAKLSTWRDPRFPTLITDVVYHSLSQDAKLSSGTDMWVRNPRMLNGTPIFSSICAWRLD